MARAEQTSTGPSLTEPRLTESRREPRRPEPGRRWSLRRRIAWFIALAIILAGTTSILAVSDSVRVLHQTEAEQSTVLPATTDAQALLADMVDQETGVRGYLLTGQAVFLQPYYSGRGGIAQQEKRLGHELNGQPTALIRLKSAVDAYQQWLNRSAEPTISAVASGHRAQVDTTSAVANGKTLFDALRTRMASLSSSLSILATEEADRQVSDERHTLVLVIVRALAVLLIAVVGVLAARSWIIRPISDLATQVRRVASGDIDYRVTVKGPNELADLGSDVEAMRRRLRDELEDARTARESLASEGMVTGLIMEELAPGRGGAAAGLDFAGRVVSVEGVLAGDWYDTIALDNGRVCVAVADISGHGAAAGMFALQIKHLLVPVLHLGLEPGAALGWVDSQMVRPDERFASAAVLEIDPTTGAARWASAGHPPALWIRSGRVEQLGPTGPILGPVGGRWLTRDLRLNPGEVIVLYTDGITEARNPAGESFGEDRLATTAARHAHDSPTELVEALLSEVREHAGGRLTDDATLLALSLPN